MNITKNCNTIDDHRILLLNEVNITCDQVRSKRFTKGYVSMLSFTQEFYRFLSSSLQSASADFPFDLFEIDFIERLNFDADIVFKSTKLISENKITYLNEFCPKLLEILKGLTKGKIPLFENVQIVGIYINAKLPAKYFFQALDQVISLGGDFGTSDMGKKQDIVIDYSSPNAAKHLHAGHIRSTIIGHVLGNMYESCGYTVHRINYLNDWGGMGVLIEGLSVRTDIDMYENKNDLLFEIYSTFRKSQKVTVETNFDILTEAEKKEISLLVGSFSNYQEFFKKYTSFLMRANNQFALLENGENLAYISWRKIVDWSLEDFERFYNILNVHQEYLTGEGLYAKSGKDLVMREVSRGTVVFFEELYAQKEIDILRGKLNNGEITIEAFERKKQEIIADIGSYVIPLDNNERFVVLKKDGSTIYATRDLAALEHRIKTFLPKKIIYEVGQEQQEHFDKLFRAAKQIGMSNDVELLHIYHGFYVDELTKKKLSSRDGASNIIKLLDDTIKYFHTRYDGNAEFTDEEKKTIAKTLGVGSIIFNDIKKDKKSSVTISSDTEKMMKQFEESGGAYLIYTSCRAKSILRKYAKPLPNISNIIISDLKDIEVDLIKKILSFTEVIKKATHGEDPAKIAEFITSIASQFNSYYNSTPILKGDKIEQGIIISRCVSQVIDNGLKILHIKTLERI